MSETVQGPPADVDFESLVAENPEEAARLLERLDEVNELLDVASLLTAAMDDEMVTSLSNLGSQLGGVADTAAEDDVARGLESVLHAVGDATEETPEPAGAVDLARALRDPEVKRGLGVALALLRALGSEVGAAETS